MMDDGRPKQRGMKDDRFANTRDDKKEDDNKKNMDDIRMKKRIGSVRELENGGKRNDHPDC